MSVLLARTAALAARPVAGVMAPRGPLWLLGPRTAAGGARVIVPPSVTGFAAAGQLVPAALCAAVAGRAPAGSRSPARQAVRRAPVNAGSR
ncbi:hypothetical protein [Streptomyces griseomycini]|uniref:Uncharacterized protein n=1 Tax=Streptomyces griseomycini TaxID=66895 RepID=A0A7W7PY95_9ACTN|nr:hypothetical protein [Streptomyces griseomycini]MBB4903546.1 hypothetical protein [Streptomyces griseomycini]GGR58379.1 hypothetical protein GCM10015536_73650 [Streptomyces griseomycini]